MKACKGLFHNVWGRLSLVGTVLPCRRDTAYQPWDRTCEGAQMVFHWRSAPQQLVDPAVNSCCCCRCQPKVALLTINCCLGKALGVAAVPLLGERIFLLYFSLQG